MGHRRSLHLKVASGRGPPGEGWLEQWVHLNLREQFCQSKGK